MAKATQVLAFRHLRGDLSAVSSTLLVVHCVHVAQYWWPAWSRASDAYANISAVCTWSDDNTAHVLCWFALGNGACSQQFRSNISILCCESREAHNESMRLSFFLCRGQQYAYKGFQLMRAF